MADELVRVDALWYERGPDTILAGVDLTVHESSVVGVRGPSGSGKTTLLHLVAGLLLPSSGRVVVAGHAVSSMRESERARVRLHNIGIVFQANDLVPELSVAENVGLPLRLMGESRRASRARAEEQLAALGIEDLANQWLDGISGGQLQRTSIARALVHRPRVVLADEPTGALDEANAAAAMRLLIEIARDRGTAVLIVTHSDAMAAACDRIEDLTSGVLLSVDPHATGGVSR